MKASALPIVTPPLSLKTAIKAPGLVQDHGSSGSPMIRVQYQLSPESIYDHRADELDPGPQSWSLISLHSTFIRAVRCRVRSSSRASHSNIRHSSITPTGIRILPLARLGLALQQSRKKQSCHARGAFRLSVWVERALRCAGDPPVRMPRRVGRIRSSSASKL